MSEAGRARCQRGHGLLVTGVGMAELYPKPGLYKRGDAGLIVTAISLGGDGDEADRRDRMQGSNLRQRDRPGEVGLRTQLARANVRSFQMHACNVRHRYVTTSGPASGDTRKGMPQIVGRSCHGGRQQGGGAVLHMRACQR